MANKLFISFAAEDLKKMETLKRSMKKELGAECEVVIVSERKDPGKPLTVKVINALNESHFFVPILTKNSINNQWVNQEIGFATALDNNARNITRLPIVDSHIMGSLKGFIHKQLDLSFNFTSYSTNHRKELASYQKACKQVSEYLQHLIPQNDTLKRTKRIDTSKLKKLMAEIYQKYDLLITELLTPKTSDHFMKTHSHAPNGYFDFLIRESCQAYSFKYSDPRNENRYLIVHANNTKPQFKLELHLTIQENAEIKLALGRILGNVELKRGMHIDEFLRQPVDYASLLAYANQRYRTFEQDDEKINTLLWRDLNKNKYKILKDIDQAVEKARPATDAYYNENPSSFVSGTDFITKSLGFVDEDFRKRHPFGTETRNAFEKYSGLIK